MTVSKIRKKKKKFGLFARPGQNLKLGTFTLHVAVQGRLRNVQKSVKHGQTELLFC